MQTDLHEQLVARELTREGPNQSEPTIATVAEKYLALVGWRAFVSKTIGCSCICSIAALLGPWLGLQRFGLLSQHSNVPPHTFGPTRPE